jgi:hypothetical protein
MRKDLGVVARNFPSDNVTSPEKKPPPAIIWWSVWSAIIVGMVVVYLMPHPSPARVPSETLRYLPLIPLLLSTVVRWKVLPRFTGFRAFPIFIIGVAFAEACGIFGIFLVPAHKQEYFFLSLAGIAQFFPIFAMRGVDDKRP